MESFSRRIFKLGINPCVNVPSRILHTLFQQAGATKGPIPVRGQLNGKGFRQTVAKYQGAWRLYLNTQMRSESGVDEGDIARIRIEFDRRPRTVPMHPLLRRAFAKNVKAKLAFAELPPSRRKEILRYLHSLKTPESTTRIVGKVLLQLTDRKTTGMNLVRR